MVGVSGVQHEGLLVIATFLLRLSSLPFVPGA